jgi:UDP-N-acetylmuramate: L-alanyl-gamma-D-glutamyl-meso-diaminopimelate ligase
MSATRSVHFIGIGDTTLLNLAIALKKKGFSVTGSDITLEAPVREELLKHGLLPSGPGWFPEKIHRGITTVVAGPGTEQS